MFLGKMTYTVTEIMTKSMCQLLTATFFKYLFERLCVRKREGRKDTERRREVWVDLPLAGWLHLVWTRQNLGARMSIQGSCVCAWRLWYTAFPGSGGGDLALWCGRLAFQGSFNFATIPTLLFETLVLKNLAGLSIVDNPRLQIREDK